MPPNALPGLNGLNTFFADDNFEATLQSLGIYASFTDFCKSPGQYGAPGLSVFASLANGDNIRATTEDAVVAKMNNPGVIVEKSFLAHGTSISAHLNAVPKSTPLSSNQGPTVASEKRPVFFFVLGECIIFLGEEKSDSLNDAKSDITAKLSHWPGIYFGTLPYLLCFAATNHQFQMHALHDTRDAKHSTQLIDVSNVLSWDSYPGRVGIIKLFLHLSRLLIKIWQTPGILPPPGAPRLFKPLTLENRTVEFFPLGVRKRLTDQTSTDVKFFRKFYGDVTPAAPWRLGDYEMNELSVKSTDGSRSSVVLWFSPAGYQCQGEFFNQPAHLRDLQKVLIDVLTMLKELHARGWYHCDIRWPNIIQSSNKYLLIDYERATERGRKFRHQLSPQTPSCPPHCGNGQPWFDTDDVWQVGQLIQISDNGHPLVHLKRDMSWNSRQNRISVDIALRNLQEMKLS